MGYGGYDGGWPPYVSVAERRLKAEREIAKLRKKGQKIEPVVIEGRTIARTFWGKAWGDNLESYDDFAYRLERGRSYVRNGLVIDLKIAEREVTAMVAGSSIYRVTVGIDAVAKAHVAVDLQGLRRWDRLADRAAAGAAVARRDGASLPPGARAVPEAEGDPLHL